MCIRRPGLRRLNRDWNRITTLEIFKAFILELIKLKSLIKFKINLSFRARNPHRLYNLKPTSNAMNWTQKS